MVPPVAVQRIPALIFVPSFRTATAVKLWVPPGWTETLAGLRLSWLGEDHRRRQRQSPDPDASWELEVFREYLPPAW
jgi:hypothetical protein